MGGEILAGILITSYAAFLAALGWFWRAARAAAVHTRDTLAGLAAAAEHTREQIDELVAAAADMRTRHDAESREYRRLLEAEQREHRRTTREHGRAIRAGDQAITKLTGDIESLEESHVIQGSEIRLLTRRMDAHDRFLEQLYEWGGGRAGDGTAPGQPPPRPPE